MLPRRGPGGADDETTGLAALLLALAAVPALAQVEPWEAAALASAPPGGAALTRSDVEAFSDGLVPAALAQGDMAGAVVVVVADGQILFSKGYGVSDVATRAPVDPERTLFRPGSVSKLFTWTAVMQLVEEGKLDLDTDVNRYLDSRSRRLSASR
ncbi:MAG: serine hydrolase domain-containing protein [Rhizomicrobium sp.]